MDRASVISQTLGNSGIANTVKYVGNGMVYPWVSDDERQYSELTSINEEDFFSIYCYFISGIKDTK